MKMRILSLVLALAVAGTLAAQPLESVLTPAGAFYTLDNLAGGNALVLTRRVGSERESTIVPATAGAALEHDGRLVFDRGTETLYVAFRRDNGDVVLVTLDRDGDWSGEHLLAIADGSRRSGLRLALTHDKDGQDTLAFVHAIWWEQNREIVPRYALIAYDGAERLSSYTGNLTELAAGVRNGSEQRESSAPEDALPLLAMSAGAKEVDVVFGSIETPTATRVKLLPKKKGDARIYTPIGRSGGNMPHPRFAAASNGNAQVMMVGDSIVVYSSGDNFTFSVYEKGSWGPVRSIKLDDSMNARQVEAALRKAVTENGAGAGAIHE